MFSVVFCHCDADTIHRHCEAWNKPWQSHAVCHAERSRTLRLSRVQNKFTCYAEAEQGRGTQASPRWLHAINAGCRLSASRRFFVTLRMTAQDPSLITNYLRFPRSLCFLGMTEHLCPMPRSRVCPAPPRARRWHASPPSPPL